ncbi:type II secretion system protein N [Legionella taurinensis]|uniref:General secretion pathway protein GspC n=1 Tax=Legionella taurinensis TaxID=70611 RepID=A0A3A5L4F0_9GAMM|nr:type II secretion system protein N [Legionella taurinensis]RJT44141.1 general secretion pathway protein GspC [Legionella taurinensis]RJT63965.1 general secretion pathway protein GspC [Legionella taurinensis]STY26580.1 general secretion pathway protein C [Legionella taurinensis]
MKASELSFLSLKNHEKAIAMAIAALFALLTLLEIYRLFKPLDTQPLRTNPAPVIAEQSIAAHSPVFTAPLFGDYVPVNMADETIKQSMLDVEIVGIMYSTQADDSQVLLRAGGGEEKSYRVGDTLPGGAVIKRIGKDGVVVLHNGTLESLSLPKNELRFEEPAKPLLEE